LPRERRSSSPRRAFTRTLSTQDLTTAVTWASSDTGVATISNAAGSEGFATSVDIGFTTISRTSVP
jgi:hypothetical protein